VQEEGDHDFDPRDEDRPEESAHASENRTVSSRDEDGFSGPGHEDAEEGDNDDEENDTILPEPNQEPDIPSGINTLISKRGRDSQGFGPIKEWAGFAEWQLYQRLLISPSIYATRGSRTCFTR